MESSEACDDVGILIDGIEEEFQVYCSISESVGTCYHKSAEYGRFHIECIRKVGSNRADIEAEFFADGADGGIEEQVVGLEHDDVVDEHFHIVYLMGADDDGAIIVHLGCNYFPELGLAGDVKAVRRFIEQQVFRLCGKGEADEGLLLLTHGQTAEIEVCGKFESSESLLKNLVRKVWVEFTVEPYVLCHGNEGKFELFGDEEYVAESFGETQAGGGAVDADTLFAVVEQSRNEVKECGFSCTVLAQQSDDFALFDFERKVGEHGGVLEVVAEREVIDADHVGVMFGKILYGRPYVGGCITPDMYIVALLYLFRNVNFGAVRLSVSDPFWGLFRDVKH